MDPADPAPPGLRVCDRRKYRTDPIWWFYLYWIQSFFREKHHLDLLAVGLPLIVIYLIADVGSVGGGWRSLPR